jgi:hypothetical protein
MRRAFITGSCWVLAVLAISGCGMAESKNKGKLEGTRWSSEKTSYMGKEVPAGHLKLTFSFGGRMTYYVGTEAYAGKFVLGSGQIVTFELDREFAGSKKHAERIWFEGEKMVVSDVLGPKVSFARLR